MSTPETGLNIKELIQRKKVSFKDVDERIPLLKEALDKMREDSAGFETRMAVVDSGMRCEYFRGKDFLRYWMSRPGELAYYLGKAEDDQTAEAKEPEEIKDQVIILAIFCMAGNLIRTAERKHTKPRPGKKKLPKWPTTLVSRYLDWDEELFYRFTYERPRGVMFYACAALLLALATFCCFYSLVPNQIKLGIAYMSISLLCFLIGSVGLRFAVFLVWWILTGQSFWIFPNLLSDEVPFFEALLPRLSLQRNEDDKSSLLKRGTTVGFMILVSYFLSEHGPDKSAVKMFTFKAHDQVLSMLQVQNANLMKIRDVTEDVHSEDFLGEKERESAGGVDADEHGGGLDENLEQDGDWTSADGDEDGEDDEKDGADATPGGDHDGGDGDL